MEDNKPKKKANKKIPLDNILIPFESNASRGGYGGSGGRRSYADRPSTSSKVSVKDQLCNINDGVLPYNRSGSGASVSDAIELCQKAYFNVGVFRNTIDTQSEFANSPLHFKGGSAKSRAFYQAWYKKIKGYKLSQQFFLEWYRSSNIFWYRTYYTLDKKKVQELKEDLGGSSVPNSAFDKDIPLRYVLLNPLDVECSGVLQFSDTNYVKILNSFEVARLKNPSTEEEREFLASLPLETRKIIKEGGRAVLKLDKKNLISVFAKKQDYEPMSVPMYYPVLFDINIKLEFKKAEIAVARQVDYMILLITMGDKENGVDAKVQLAMQDIFKKESVGRTIVADYTTKMEFVMPDFKKIMGPEKYEIVNRDIANGLMNVFFEDDKFASGMIKTKIFLERLNEARKAFLNDFLIPEMEHVAEIIGLRDIPLPHFEEIDIQDETQLQRVYARLVEVGVLTPKDFFEVSETGIFPDSETSIKNQQEYKELRDEGLYSPLIGGGSQVNQNGRPEGISTPQSTKKVTPQSSMAKFSLAAIKDTAYEISELIEYTEAAYKQKFNFKRLSAANKENASKFVERIISNEEKSKWKESVDLYLNGQENTNNSIVNAVIDISAKHDLDLFSAAFLYHSPSVETSDK